MQKDCASPCAGAGSVGARRSLKAGSPDLRGWPGCGRVKARAPADTLEKVFPARLLSSILEIAMPPAARLRGLLLPAFAGLLALVLAVGVYSLALFRQVRRRSAALRAQADQRTRALNRIRYGILLSGTLARDFILSPEGPEPAALRRRILVLEEETAEALDRCGPESPALTSLRGEIHAYWRLLSLMMDLGRERQSAGVGEFFRREMTARREGMLRIAGRVMEMSRAEARDGDARLAAVCGRAGWSAAAAMVLALAGGALLAGRTLHRAQGLEIEGARARADLQDLSARLLRAQEEERKAVVRELHNGIGQPLSALIVEAANAGAAGPDRWRMDSIGLLARRALEAARGMALSLRPSMLDDFGLAPALEWQAREITRRTGLQVKVSADPDAPKLPDEHRTCIYRVAQEALDNAARHAGARRVRLTLNQTAHHVSLTVGDDGSGFDPRRVRGPGLLGIEERVTRLGGSVLIDSSPGRGTVISVRVPLQEAAAAAPRATA
jgi:signal transduction histidine kinase